MTKMMTKTKVAILSGLLVAMLTVGLATAQAGGGKNGGHGNRGHGRPKHHPGDRQGKRHGCGGHNTPTPTGVPSETPTVEPTPTDPPS